MAKSNLSAVEIFILMATAVVSVATSKTTYTNEAALTYKFGVATNCANATQNNIEIQVSSGQVTSPTGVTFLSFGLPVPTMNVGDQTITGEVTPGITRSCIVSESSNNGARMSLYACSENGATLCQVSFTYL